MGNIPYHLLACPHCNQSASYQFVLGTGCSHAISCRFCHRRFTVRVDMGGNIDRILKNGEENTLNQSGGTGMKVCPQCNKEIKDTAKFCGGCGYKFPAEDSPATIEKRASFIQWQVLPGQLAVKIDSGEIASYGRVKGIVIQEGIRALVFVNGKIVTELGAGSYEFKEFPDVRTGSDDEERRFSRIRTFLNNLRNFFRNAPQLPQHVQNVAVVLVRSTEFPLVFAVKDVATAGIRSEVGLHILCRISNINAFYADALLDKPFVSFDSLKATVEPAVKPILDAALASVSPDAIATAQEAVRTALQEKIGSLYAYFEVTKIIQITATNAEVERIRGMQEELYVSELELVELTKRNRFLNRMQDENNAQSLHEAQSEADFRAALDKIDERRELNEDERTKFSQMLAAQRMIREARTQEEIEAAIAVFKKSGMLRDEELDNVRAQVEQNAALRNLTYEQALHLATVANEAELDRQRLQWEIEVGNQRIQNEIERKRMQDAYDDERRRAEMALDKEEQLTQLELLKQAQAVRNEREEAEHKRQMETLTAQQKHEAEMRRMFKDMSAEQIVAANPDITPEAAQAMAEKFKAEAAAAQNDKTAELAMKQSADMQAFMQQQMQMMRDMAVAGMGAHAQTHQQMMDAKDAEMNRFASGVNNAVSAVSGALRNPATVVQAGGAAAVPAKDAKAAAVCPHCGTPHEVGALFCENCGGSL